MRGQGTLYQIFLSDIIDNYSIHCAADKKDSLWRTQLTRSLESTINDADDSNEEANLRSRNMRILKTTTEYPESGLQVVKIDNNN